MNLAKKINLHYTTIQGSFGIGFGALMSFGAVLMLSRGLSNSALGVVTCIAQLLPMVLQPAVTSFAAARRGMTTRKMLMLLTLPILVMAVVMLLAQLTMQSMAGYVYPNYYAAPTAQSVSTVMMLAGMLLAGILAKPLA